jgi:1-acyl-sn-glycerol-3-phosphate acyltransferase/long-chain acyl-CoA synthetase
VAVRSSTQETLQLDGLAAPGVRDARAVRYAFECFVRTVFRTYVRLEVGPCDHLPSGSFLLCSNHSSHLDGAALMVASGLPFDSFRLLAAADYFSPQSSAGRLTRAMLNIVSIDRSSGHAVRLRRTVAECRELVRGEPVRLIAFPEGTRSTTGSLLPFKRGAAFLAVELGLPIVPAHIDGAREALPKGSWLPRPGRIRVRFGRPILPGEWATATQGHQRPSASSPSSVSSVPSVAQKARCGYVAREIEQRITDLAREARATRRPERSA